MKKQSKQELLERSKKVMALAAERRARMAAKAEKVKAESADAAPLAPAGDHKAKIGEEEYGYAIPPELEEAVAEGVAKDSEDESYQPGILVPPGLEEQVMAFVDPALLSADAEVRFDLVPFAPEAATTAAEVINAGAHWVLFANGDPLAKINLNDQENAERIAAHFVSEDYARSVVEGIQKHGLKATLEATKAKAYVAKVDENAKIAEIKAKLEADAKTELRASIANTKSKYVESLGLVLEASASNFIVENALKDSLVAFMTSAGIPEGTAAEGVDNAFFQSGVKTIANFLDKAEEWANLSPEALSEIKAALEQAGRRARPLPSTLTPAQANPDFDQNMANRMAASAVTVQQPGKVEASVAAVTPSTEPASADAKSSFRNRFGGFRTY